MGHGYEIGCSECKEKGTIFNIATGGGMLLFCKEQLEEHYKKNIIQNEDLPIENELINKEILNNLKDGYNFTENLGNLPYYCTNCKKLSNYFYFQMKKDELIYIPKYFCSICNNKIEPVCTTWEISDGGTWSETLKNIKFKYFLYQNENNILLKDENERKEITCNKCGNNIFLLVGEYFYD